MTNEELDTMKYKICCPICDNYKCVRGTEKCEAELWKKRRMEQMTNEMTEKDKLYADELRKRALADYERLDHAINELERQPILDTRQRERQLEMEYQHGYDKGWKEGRKALEQTRWIPVSERLPEEEGHYLTTTMYHEVFCDYWNKERFERTETIIAWMPLPQPYSESEEEGE